MKYSDFVLNENIQILTESGFVDFLGVQKSLHEKFCIVSFDSGYIQCAAGHMIKTDAGFKRADELLVGDMCNGKTVICVGVVYDKIELFDVIESSTHTYTTNGVESHNCAFLSDKGTLVNSRIIEALKYKDPVEEIGDLRLFTDNFRGRKLAMACDCGEGIGQDYHAIQIIDIEKMEQVGEYQNNILTQTQFTKELVRIVKMLFGRGASDIFYTIENNGVGNGVMRLIENVEDPVFSNAMLISEPGAKKLGLATTGKNKIKGCMQLKDLIELGMLKINSERFITQLKFFVKTGASYAAESGANDDLCMAMVVLMNMLVILADYEDSVFNVVSEVDLSTGSEHEELWGIAF